MLLIGVALSYEKYSNRQLQKMYMDKKYEYHMGYASAGDEKEHFKEFCAFANMVKEHNEDDGTEWQGEINKFALMTPAEREMYHGVNVSVIMDDAELEIKEQSEEDDESQVDPEDTTDSVDYSEKLPPVKDQGRCGSCWTFGAVVPLEYQVNRKSKSIKNLSEQQYLDCVCERYAEEDGCKGGWPAYCYSWTKKNNNLIASQKDYPYVARDGPCNKNVQTAISGFKVLGTKYLYGEKKMLAAVKDSSKGVLSVAIGTVRSFHSYKSGVYSGVDCDKKSHAVNVVGYGTLNGIPYWQVRNSWGPDWGDKGYIKMKRGSNMCAIATYPYYPIVTGGDDDDEDEQDDKKKTCNWKKLSNMKLNGKMSSLKHAKSDAMKLCESERKCVGISCKSDKKCMLNKSVKGKSNKNYTGYICQ